MHENTAGVFLFLSESVFKVLIVLVQINKTMEIQLISVGWHRDEMNDEQIHNSQFDVIVVQITNFLYF